MIQQTKHANYHTLFDLFARNLDKYKLDRMLYEIEYLNHHLLKKEENPTKENLLRFFTLMNNVIMDKGFDFMLRFFQNHHKKNFMLNESKPIEEQILDTKKIVCEVFEIEEKSIFTSSSRNGVRVASIGSLVKLVNETLGIDMQDMYVHLDKKPAVLSSCRRKLNELNPKVPHDQNMINNYLTAKYKLIKKYRNGQEL